MSDDDQARSASAGAAAHDPVPVRRNRPWRPSSPSSSVVLAQGQVLIITARWIMVAAGLLLTFWNPGAMNELRVQILVVLALAGANFYLHAQLLMRRPAVDSVVYLVSVADLAVITILVMMQGGFTANAFTFYYPALLAISVAFPTGMTFLFVGAVMAFYAFVTSATGAATDGNVQIIVSRLITLAAVPVCGSVYRRIENERQQAGLGARHSDPELPRHQPAVAEH